MAATIWVARFTPELFVLEIVCTMEPITIPNHCCHFRGFVCRRARFGPGNKTIEADVRPPEGAAALRSACHTPVSGFGLLPQPPFESRLRAWR